MSLAKSVPACSNMFSCLWKKLGTEFSPAQPCLLYFDAKETKDLSLTWFTGQFLQNVWSTSTQKKQPQRFMIRADLEAKTSLLRETRFQNVCVLIEEMIQNLENNTIYVNIDMKQKCLPLV